MLHFRFRTLVVAGALAFAAACTQQQLVDPTVASTLQVASVSVDAATASQRQIRGFTFTEGEAEAILEQEIRSVFAQATGGTRNVTAQVSVTSIYIPNVLAGVLLGSNYPTASADVQLIDAANGTAIGAPFTVNVGGAQTTDGIRPGIIGAAAIGSETDEFAALGKGLGTSIRDAIFGAPQ